MDETVQIYIISLTTISVVHPLEITVMLLFKLYLIYSVPRIIIDFLLSGWIDIRFSHFLCHGYII